MSTQNEVHDHPSGAKRCQNCKSVYRTRCPHCDFPHAEIADELTCKHCPKMLKGYWFFFPSMKPKKPKKKGWWRR